MREKGEDKYLWIIYCDMRLIIENIISVLVKRLRVTQLVDVEAESSG